MLHLLVRFILGTYFLIQEAVLACVPTTVLEKICRWIFAKSGITINGNGECNIRVHNPAFYRRVANDHNLGLGEAYMEGWWDTDDLLEVYRRLCLDPFIPLPIRLRDKADVWLGAHESQQRKDIAKLYDLGNDLYESYLDPYMNYTAGYWKGAETLAQAQVNKMDLIARKLKLEPGMTVLDLGCGSGGLAKYLAENYQVKVVGYNISKEQCEYAEKLCKGLPVTIVLDDYRNATGEFDRVFSVGLVEHLGHNNYRTYFEVVDRCLKADGIHVFESMVRFDEQMPDHDKFLDTYVLPHSQLPLLTQFLHAMEDLFILEDLQNIGYDYHKTLVAWYENFQKAWPKFEAKYGQKFYRMFSIFLCSMGGFFKARKIQCCQIVLTKTKLARTYER